MNKVKTCGAAIECLDGALYPEEAAFVGQAVPGRKREFIAGRICARRALAELGIAEAPLRVNADRTPDWPPGVVGSIAHTNNYCGVAVARVSDARGVGFDVESVGDFRLEYLPKVCTRNELLWLRRLAGEEQQKTGALIFSAKESFYKCQYAITKRWLGFHHVEVEPDSTGSNFGEFIATLLIDMQPAIERPFSVSGKYSFKDGLVMTGITLRP
ncbi:MAG TPA: 4'-phosphopantetheinyl transferase superfamily protein [Blastocatellia bacterium]|nr:4'-phosphopantetheinyl transferase superfamily protein [Blastocatellia bacterium]